MDDFEQFWAAYPRKVAKVVARRAWVRAMKKVTLADLMSALEKHKGTKQWREGVIPNPATFLNQERWTDELERPALVVNDSLNAAIAQQIETRRRRAEMQAQGMTDDQIEAVFEAEYEARR